MTADAVGPRSNFNKRTLTRHWPVTYDNNAGLFLYSVKQMDFFERWFGFSGGRGDGSLEFIFLVVLFAIIVVIASRYLSTLKTK
jgi:class III signal peptide